MGSHHLSTGIQYNIMGFNLKRAPVQEPEVEQTIKVEEPEIKTFKKDETSKINIAKTRQDNHERDDKLAREEENLAREKENLARDNAPTKEKKAIQNISTGPTPARVATASQVFTSAYTQSAHHSRNLGILTKSESSTADTKPEPQATRAMRKQTTRCQTHEQGAKATRFIDVEELARLDKGLPAMQNA
jgi:hypothetical protein